MSVATIPDRCETLSRVVSRLLASCSCNILLPHPQVYRKWPGKVWRMPSIPDSMMSERVIPFVCERDYGPATKLLGALEYLRQQRGGYTHILTLDDDLLYGRSTFTQLFTAAETLPDAVVTGLGIRLAHPPYKNGEGLDYNTGGWVDAPRGYAGVLYPVGPLSANESVWPSHADLPLGIFHDDDAYFGIVMGAIGVPIWSVHGEPPSDPGWHGSAVEQGSDRGRINNESELYRFAVRRGWLPATRRAA